MTTFWRWCFVLALLCAPAACAHHLIPGTQVVETPQTREIYDLIVHLRDCLQRRDAAGLLAMVSKTYFEDNGTPDPKDDYGYLELQDRLAKDSLDTAKELLVSFQIFDITIQGNVAQADMRYSSRARLELPSGRLWDTNRDFDRIEFVREDGAWRITSGL
jgi:hypothetical protein